MEKEEIIKIIKNNPQINYEDMKKQALDAGMALGVFDNAWKTTRERGKVLKYVLIGGVVLVVILGTAYALKRHQGPSDSTYLPMPGQGSTLPMPGQGSTSSCPPDSACRSGFAIDEFGNCSPECTGDPEICNAMDDDCDGKIDEGDVCVIDPLTTTEDVSRPIVNTTKIEKDGVTYEVAHDRISVSLKASAITSDSEKASLLKFLTPLGAKVIGQTTFQSVVLIWQIAVDDPAKLQEIQKQIKAHTAVRDAELNMIMGFSGGNRLCP